MEDLILKPKRDMCLCLRKMIKLKNKMNKKQKNQRFFENNFFLRKNRKGEKLISVYWFAILFIVAAAIVYMTALFYGAPYDIRKLEADILTDQIADCFSKAGYFNEEIGEENFLRDCDLNFDIGDVSGSGEEGRYYVEVNVFEFGTEEVSLEIKEGNVNLKLNCDLEGKNLPYCLERSFYSVNENSGERYEIKILSVVKEKE